MHLDSLHRHARDVYQVFQTILISACLLVTGCNQASITTPQTLRIGLPPDQERIQLQNQFTPLLDYITNRVELPYKIVYADSYIDLVKKFGNKEIDIAYFGGVSFVKANDAFGANPLVIRDIDHNFTSVIITLKSNPANTIEELMGARFSFGSKLSTSGHYMPRYFLNSRGIIPEDFFSQVIHSKSHDATAQHVLDGSVDAGAMNASIAKKMLENDSLPKNKIKIIWQTPPYHNYVWATQKNMNHETRLQLRNAFLSLTKSNKEHLPILEKMDANYFLPTSKNDFNEIKKVIQVTESTIL